MDQKDLKLYGDYTMQDLYKQVIQNTRKTRKDLKSTIDTLVSHMKTLVDVQVLSPQIANYMNIIVKNEQLMIKIATVAAKVNYVAYKNSGQQGVELSQQQKQKMMKQASTQATSILYELRNSTLAAAKQA